MSPLLYSNLFIISSFLSFFLLCYVLINRKVLALYKTFVILFFGVSIWSFFYGLELRTDNYALVRIYLKIQYLGITVIPLYWFRFTSKYIGKTKWLKPGNFALLSVIPALTLILVLTYEHHSLFYKDSFLKVTNSGAYHQFTPGIFYFIHIIYSYLLIFLALMMLISAYFTVSIENRSRLNILILSSLIPFIMSGVYMLGVRPEGSIDLTPLGFLIMSFILLRGVLNTRLLEVKPVMINSLFDHLPAAVFATDNNRSIISMNSKARKLITDSVVSEMSIRDLTYIADYAYVVENDAYVTEIESAGQYFRVHRNVLTNDHKEQEGYLYLIYNITREKKYQEVIGNCESKYQLLFTLSHQGILIIRNKKLVSVNPLIEKLTHFSSDELINGSVFDIVYDEDMLSVNNLFNRIKYTGVREKSGAFRLKSRNNDPVVVSFSIHKTEWDGDEAYIMFLTPSYSHKKPEC